MTCSAAAPAPSFLPAGRVERALTALPGVTAAAANLATRSVSVTHAPDVSPAALAGAVSRAGYPASALDQAAPPRPAGDETARIKRNMIVAAVLTLPVFVLEMGGHAVPAFHHWLMAHVSTGALHWVELLLTLAVLAWPGRMFFTHGIPALLRGAPEMNSLVALGASPATDAELTAVVVRGPVTCNILRGEELLASATSNGGTLRCAAGLG